MGKPIERLVYASSSSVYGDEVEIPMRETAVLQPVSPYGVTKLAAEQLCYLYHFNYQVPTVSLRYFTVYGPRQRPDMGFNRFFRAILDGKPLVQFGDGLQTRDFTFVADAVRATADAAVRGVPGRVYNIGGGAACLVEGGLRPDRPCFRTPDHDRSPAPAKGRHARHLRGHHARPDRPRVCAVGDARRGSSRDVAVDGSE